MLSILRPACILFLLLSAVTGVIYPYVVTLTAQLLFPQAAHGSIIERDGHAIASSLIGQPFSEPGHFWGRPSSTAPVPYNALGGSGSNLAPTNPALFDAVRVRVEALRAADPQQTDAVPIDWVTTSASGLDPHISPAAAYYQARRVAHVRQLSEAKVRELIAKHTEPPYLGLFGAARVHVLQLNLELDKMK